MLWDPGKQENGNENAQDDCSKKTKKFNLATVQRACRANTEEGRSESSKPGKGSPRHCYLQNTLHVM